MFVTGYQMTLFAAMLFLAPKFRALHVRNPGSFPRWKPQCFFNYFNCKRRCRPRRPPRHHHHHHGHQRFRPRRSLILLHPIRSYNRTRMDRVAKSKQFLWVPSSQFGGIGCITHTNHIPTRDPAKREGILILTDTLPSSAPGWIDHGSGRTNEQTSVIQLSHFSCSFVVRRGGWRDSLLAGSRGGGSRPCTSPWCWSAVVVNWIHSWHIRFNCWNRRGRQPTDAETTWFDFDGSFFWLSVSEVQNFFWQWHN